MTVLSGLQKNIKLGDNKMKYAIMNNGEFVEATYDPCTKEVVDVKLYESIHEAIFNCWRKGEQVVAVHNMFVPNFYITEPLEEDLCPGY
jgi:hypothetical protein